MTAMVVALSMLESELLKDHVEEGDGGEREAKLFPPSIIMNVKKNPLWVRSQNLRHAELEKLLVWISPDFIQLRETWEYLTQICLV